MWFDRTPSVGSFVVSLIHKDRRSSHSTVEGVISATTVHNQRVGVDRSRGRGAVLLILLFPPIHLSIHLSSCSILPDHHACITLCHGHPSFVDIPLPPHYGTKI